MQLHLPGGNATIICLFNHTNILPLTTPRVWRIGLPCLAASQCINDTWTLLHADNIRASRTIILGPADESIVREVGTIYHPEFEGAGDLLRPLEAAYDELRGD